MSIYYSAFVEKTLVIKIKDIKVLQNEDVCILGRMLAFSIILGLLIRSSAGIKS